MSLCVSHGQQGLIVEHLFKVRDQPLLIHGIAMETKTDLVKDAPHSHSGQRLFYHFQPLRIGAPLAPPQEKGKVVWSWKFRHSAKPSPSRIKNPCQLRETPFQGFLADRINRRIRIGLGLNGGRDGLARLEDARPVLLPHGSDLLKDIHKTRHPQPAGFWKVAAGKEGFSFGGHENGKGPTPVSGQGLAYEHVDLVYIWTLFTVYLDGDKILVQKTGHFVIFKRLVCHDMAPVTRGIPNGKKDRPVLCLCLLEGVITPGIPVHRVVGMLEKIRAFFVP